MRDTANILSVASLEPDYIGFIFYKASKRYVDEDFLMPIIPSAIQKVGVFVNASLDYIIQKTQAYNLDIIQLHGEETPNFCQELSQNTNVPIVKVFGIADDFNFSILESYISVVHAFLFDTKGQDRGGNGISFDWTILKKYLYSTPLWISGGIGLDNISDLLTFLGNYPQLPIQVLDVNSCFEDAPALKNMEKLTKLKSLLASII